MVYDLWQILRVLVDGGWFTVSASADGERVARLWQFVDGWEYEHLCIPERTFANYRDCGIIEFWRSGVDRDSRPADCYFLTGRGEGPLSN